MEHRHRLGSTRPDTVTRITKAHPRGELMSWCAEYGCDAQVKVSDYWKLCRGQEESGMCWKTGREKRGKKGRKKVRT